MTIEKHEKQPPTPPTEVLNKARAEIDGGQLKQFQKDMIIEEKISKIFAEYVKGLRENISFDYARRKSSNWSNILDDFFKSSEFSTEQIKNLESLFLSSYPHTPEIYKPVMDSVLSILGNYWNNYQTKENPYEFIRFSAILSFAQRLVRDIEKIDKEGYKDKISNYEERYKKELNSIIENKFPLAHYGDQPVMEDKLSPDRNVALALPLSICKEKGLIEEIEIPEFDIPLPISFDLAERLKREDPETFGKIVPIQRGRSQRSCIYPHENKWIKIKGIIHDPSARLRILAAEPSGELEFTLPAFRIDTEFHNLRKVWEHTKGLIDRLGISEDEIGLAYPLGAVKATKVSSDKGMVETGLVITLEYPSRLQYLITHPPEFAKFFGSDKKFEEFEKNFARFGRAITIMALAGYKHMDLHLDNVTPMEIVDYGRLVKIESGTEIESIRDMIVKFLYGVPSKIGVGGWGLINILANVARDRWNHTPMEEREKLPLLMRKFYENTSTSEILDTDWFRSFANGLLLGDEKAVEEVIEMVRKREPKTHKELVVMFATEVKHKADEIFIRKKASGEKPEEKLHSFGISRDIMARVREAFEEMGIKKDEFDSYFKLSFRIAEGLDEEYRKYIFMNVIPSISGITGKEDLESSLGYCVDYANKLKELGADPYSVLKYNVPSMADASKSWEDFNKKLDLLEEFISDLDENVDPNDVLRFAYAIAIRVERNGMKLSNDDLSEIMNIVNESVGNIDNDSWDKRALSREIMNVALSYIDIQDIGNSLSKVEKIIDFVNGTGKKCNLDWDDIRSLMTGISSISELGKTIDNIDKFDKFLGDIDRFISVLSNTNSLEYLQIVFNRVIPALTGVSKTMDEFLGNLKYIGKFIEELSGEDIRTDLILEEIPTLLLDMEIDTDSLDKYLDVIKKHVRKVDGHILGISMELIAGISGYKSTDDFDKYLGITYEFLANRGNLKKLTEIEDFIRESRVQVTPDTLKEIIDAVSEDRKGKIKDLTYESEYIKKIQKQSPQLYEKLNDVINEFKEGEFWLDLGCGKGELLEYLASKGIEGFGLDISAEEYRGGVEGGIILKSDKDRDYKVKRIFKGDAEHLEFVEDNSVKVVSAFNSALYFGDIPKWLREVHRVLEENGYLIIHEFPPLMVMDKRDIRRELHNAASHFEAVEKAHAEGLSVPIHKILELAGYEITFLEIEGHPTYHYTLIAKKVPDSRVDILDDLEIESEKITRFHGEGIKDEFWVHWVKGLEKVSQSGPRKEMVGEEIPDDIVELKKKVEETEEKIEKLKEYAEELSNGKIEEQTSDEFERRAEKLGLNLEKVRNLIQWKDRYMERRIEDIDPGINADNLKEFLDLGRDVLVEDYRARFEGHLDIEKFVEFLNKSNLAPHTVQYTVNGME
ncbi:MAG TPA: class I SAM-dependent methyltransferase, partial [Candidatus Altiarchaeales archaeon]|nr:class I SAM-dependent methyltransferase [Candidatus Altiarchaeales archaeon]